MESRREFLTRSTGLLTGLTLVPGASLPRQDGRPSDVWLAVRTEIPRVVCEFQFHVFRQNYLPALSYPRPSPLDKPGPDLAQWQKAAGWLNEALPHMNAQVPAPSALNEFLEFHRGVPCCFSGLPEPLAEP